MRILLVEDNATFAAELESAIRGIPHCEVDTVTSQDEAMHCLGHEFYDLIILDREISPSADRALESSKEHGWNLFLYIEANAPGIPVRFLTGFWDTGLAEDLMSYARPSRACGAGATVPLYSGLAKNKVHLLKREVEDMAKRISAIDEIPVIIENRNSPAPMEEERVLRLFANLRGGVAVRATPFTDGLSGASVHKVAVLNASQEVLEVCVAKIGPSKEIHTEQTKHRDYFTKLKGGCVPNGTEIIDSGAGSWSGAFYSLAAEDALTLFSTISTDVVRSCDVVRGIETAQENWRNSGTQYTRSVRQIRQRFIGNTKLAKISDLTSDLGLPDAESSNVISNECVQHRDLHGANVLVGANHAFHLIDYAEAQTDCSCSDALMLELSILFHKDAVELRENWPNAEQLRHWDDLEVYLEGCPFPNFVRSCREWAERSAGSPEEILATAYAISLRQLQYDDVDKKIGLAIAKRCLNRLQIN
ncbi:Response regulator receiver domain protein [Phaeobacter piscinae]|uniref:Response regulator receiver domain protein n=1 Tax=Phaeobacter piscinae TaxID=1580596 RepID=A0ABN5DDU3_9RHOB|nr:response regulator [Phaeobacter piscinae]ATG35467.1 Response regulator receiver domain protein [Phaeobacter piscinae]AUQ85987.1 Response regulator receiver domain protein [Phaeobacter piscinae]AUR23871.1 Response regulator receiver domain protein [Phaeobacter piscinae]